MSQKKLSLWLKLIIVGCALCGVVLFGFILPGWLQAKAAQSENPVHGLTIFMWIAAVPCYAVLACGWRIANAIGKDRSFCAENARMLKVIAMLAAGDAAYVLLGNVVFLLLRWNLPALALISAFVCFVGLAISVGAACLSHLVLKAAKLQEENDLTI